MTAIATPSVLSTPAGRRFMAPARAVVPFLIGLALILGLFAPVCGARAAGGHYNAVLRWDKPQEARLTRTGQSIILRTQSPMTARQLQMRTLDGSRPACSAAWRTVSTQRRIVSSLTPSSSAASAIR